MIPSLMTGLNQWVVCDGSKVPKYWNNEHGKIENASVIKSETWMSYDNSCQIAKHYGWHIGFVLTSNDPLCCIDFDIKDIDSLDSHRLPLDDCLWTPEHIIRQQDSIINNVNSYKELSLSGKGVHVWLLGDSGEGARRGGVEVYSKERFMVCTGLSFNHINRSIVDSRVVADIDNVVIDLNSSDEFLSQVLSLLKQDAGLPASVLIEVEPIDNDSVILDRASSAANADKFTKLFGGQWQELGYPSQSEADFSLMSMFTFYSASNSQCRRLFRQSELGRRAKATKNDTYLNYALSSIRSRQAREHAVLENAALSSLLLVNGKNIDVTEENTEEVSVDSFESLPFFKIPNFKKVGGLDWPPGVVGEVAQFLMETAPRPVKEIAIASAVGFFAGACGKSYHLSGTGLNIYLLLIARSAVGKEAINGGLSILIKNLIPTIPEVGNFYNFSAMSSPQALTKAMEEWSCFLNFMGEVGKKLEEFNRNPMMRALKDLIIDAYQKSGPNSIATGRAYSDKEKNIALKSVAYSIIGEGTPGSFYDNVTDDMMSDGFLSRFTIIEYDGDRPLPNYYIDTIVPPLLLLKLQTFFNCTLTNLEELHGINRSVRVKFTTEADIMFWDFNCYCDRMINLHPDQECFRQLWNRAHLKALKFSGILAVADNPITPTIDKTHAEWAINLTLQGIYLLESKIKNGDVGVNVDRCNPKIIQILEAYLKCQKADYARYFTTKDMIAAGIVPRKYLQMRTCSLSNFKNHHLGATFAMNEAIKSLIDNGNLVEVSSQKMIEKHGLHGKHYQIVNLT